MAGGAYVALSGLRARADHLDRLAADIANGSTSGYKARRGTTTEAERPMFDRALQAAVDVAPGPARYDFRAGAIAPTGRDLDFALEGRGFFVVDTPAGPRYTRNGHFTRAGDGTLVTEDGHAVLGVDGPIRLGEGELSVEPDGTIRTGAAIAGRLRIVDFDDYNGLVRESGSRFRAPVGVQPTAAAEARLQSGAIERSNVSMVERIAELTEVTRTFEALQKGVSVLMNDLDGRAITELGRR
ncbi:MAG TPA: flagellar hook basal-body protein [Vicinamibacterales bacterium]